MKTYESRALAASAVSMIASQPATRLLHDAPGARVALFRLEPGQEIPPHASPSTVLLTVVSGSGIIAGAEGDRAVHTGDIVVFNENERHAMRAVAEQFVIAAVTAPRPGGR